MNLAPIVTELIAGGVGGNIASALVKKYNLGPIGHTSASPLLANIYLLCLRSMVQAWPKKRAHRGVLLLAIRSDFDECSSS